MLYRFVLPDLGEGIAEGVVLEWLVRAGQTIVVDDPIAEVSTDKADVVIPSPVAGLVQALCVEPGQVVPVGTVLAEIVTDGHATAPPPAMSPASSAGVVTPPIQRLAHRLGVDPATIRPTDPRARVTASDVRSAASRRARNREGRETIARRLTEAAAIPVVTAVDEADFEAVRAAGRAPLAAVAQATVIALGEHPELNAWMLDTGECRKHDYVHLGIATHTPRGLVVPCIRHADRLSPDELADAITSVTTMAREGRARPDALRGSTFTITSAGRLSGLFAAPLLNLPEVAILGLYRVERRAVVRDDAVVPRHTAHISITFDHRAIDGLAAARFLSRVIHLLESSPLDAASSRGS